MFESYCSKKVPKGFFKGKIRIRVKIPSLTTCVRPMLKPAGELTFTKDMFHLRNCKNLIFDKQLRTPLVHLTTCYFLAESTRLLGRTICLRIKESYYLPPTQCCVTHSIALIERAENPLIIIIFTTPSKEGL